MALAQARTERSTADWTTAKRGGGGGGGGQGADGGKSGSGSHC